VDKLEKKTLTKNVFNSVVFKNYSYLMNFYGTMLASLFLEFIKLYAACAFFMRRELFEKQLASRKHHSETRPYRDEMYCK
jgi:hypothetical protein